MNLAFRIGFTGVGRQEWDQRLQKLGVDAAWDSEGDLAKVRVCPLAVNSVELAVVVELLNEDGKNWFSSSLSRECQ